jgi:hydrogenase/urease accessory protein HupE
VSSRAVATAIALASALVCASALAHDFRPGLLRLDEQAPGRFATTWVPPRLQSGTARITPMFPAHCRPAAATLECGTEGLVGEIAFAGIDRTKAEIVVQLTWLDGTTRTEVVGARDRPIRVGGAAARGGATQIALAYGALGVEHIVGGIDHLLFVLGLVLVVGFARKLVWTITAFTVAHCLTLAGSTLGWIELPQPPVEAAIALSIVLVAAESLHRRPTLTRRSPWLVAFAFGLLHGFGFAGALQEVGLPPRQIPLSLSCFNVGVELGQLGVIALLWVVARAAPARWAARTRLPAAIAYAMGTVAVYWTIARVSAFWA